VSKVQPGTIQSRTIQRGTIALVGSGEFLEAIDPLDRYLLGRVIGTPRVTVLPTASAPDGPGVPERWAQMGVDHFLRLGVPVEPALVLTRADAESDEMAGRIAASNFVYLSGGKPAFLRDTLRDTACWRAIAGVFEAGGVVAGCSAGAMVLAGQMFDSFRVWRTVPALGLAPNFLVIPHFDEIPGILGRVPAIATEATGGTGDVSIVGVEGSTGLVGADLEWIVRGRGGVTLFDHGRATRYRDGEQIVIPGSARELQS
jgi:cyanophycinase